MLTSARAIIFLFALVAVTYAYSLPNLTPPLFSRAPAPQCAYGSHVVTAGETCASISRAASVSTWSLAKANGLALECPKLAAGMVLCLPQRCRIYVIEEGMTTCYDVVKKFPGLGYFFPAYYNP